MTTVARPDVTPLKEFINTHYPTSELKDKQGRYLFRALFNEESNTKESYQPIFTLSESHSRGLHSIHQLYVQFADPSEYIFAMTVLGSYEHWQMLKSRGWFQPYYLKMRRAMAARLISLGQDKMLKLGLEEGDRVATKWIADGQFLRTPDELASHKVKTGGDPITGSSKAKSSTQGRGRPSKDEIEGRLTQMAQEEKEHQELLEAARTASTTYDSTEEAEEE
jgi:hypothetical protein